MEQLYHWFVKERFVYKQFGNKTKIKRDKCAIVLIKVDGIFGTNFVVGK